jgi:hypothetical protein
MTDHSQDLLVHLSMTECKFHHRPLFSHSIVVRSAIIACRIGLLTGPVNIVPSSMHFCSWASRRRLKYVNIILLSETMERYLS